MGCAEKEHKWEYVWGGQYRRCKVSGCDAREWNIHDAYYQKQPCGMGAFDLTYRALGYYADKESKQYIPKGVNGKPRGANNSRDYWGALAGKKDLKGIDLKANQKQIEERFFIAQGKAARDAAKNKE